MTLSSIPDSRSILQVWLKDYVQRKFFCFHKKTAKTTAKREAKQSLVSSGDIKTSEGALARSNAGDTGDFTLGETVPLP